MHLRHWRLSCVVLLTPLLGLSTSVPLPDAFNRKAEYLLGEYGLFKWMNGRYHGADLSVKY